MNRSQIIDDQLRDWVDLGDEQLPSRFLDAALARIETTPQRGAGWRPLSDLIMKVQPAAAVLGIAALGIAALAIGYALGWINPQVVAPPSPSPTAQALLWSPARSEMDWPLPVREEPSGAPVIVRLERSVSGRPEDPRTFTDPSGDIDASGPGWVDITRLEIRYATGVSLASRVTFDLATRVTTPMPHPLEAWVAYGMVVDLNGDGVGDMRLGMDNAPEGLHRAWKTDLLTGKTAANTGAPYGMVGDFYFDTFLPGEVPTGRMLVQASDMGEFKFYVWASLIDDGRVVATDYAPDAGWFDLAE